MAMEIIVQPQMSLALAEAIPLPPSVPPAPPIPSHWSVQTFTYVNSKVAKSATKGVFLRDNDSGMWPSLDDLPGCGLSDDDFSEEFSRRGSTGSALARGVPTPPPVPPLPSYLPTPPQSPMLLRFISDTSYLDSISIGPDFDPANPYGIYDSDSYLDDAACIVCYDASGSTYGRSSWRRCCDRPVCRECMVNVVHAKIGLEGIVHMDCPNPDCDAPLSKSEIMDLLGGNSELKERFERMRLEAEGDGSKKACPNCYFLTEHELPSTWKYHEEDIKITCVKCTHDWCYNCQAPWHQGVSCKQFQKGDKQFSKWTKGKTTTGVANCQKCPLCCVYIQRSTGCNHMTCNRCDTHFCYKCGGRFMEIPGLGDHYDRISVLGCKNNYKANQPVQRKAIRGGYLGAKIASLTGYPVLFVAGVAVVVVVGAVALPIYGGYRFYKFRKNTNRAQRRRRHH